MIEVEAPDGTIVEFPDGTPRDVMRQAMQKRFAPQPESNFSQLDSGVLGAAQGATLGFGDELSGFIGAVVDGFGGPEGFIEAYQRHAGDARAMLKEAEGANPRTFLGGEIVGGIAPALVPGVGTARAAGMGGKMLAGAAGGSGIGGAAGVGAGEGLEESLARGAEGALTGATIGAALAPVAAGVGKVAGGIRDKFTKGAVGRAEGISRPAVNRVAKMARADAAANRNLGQGLDDADMVLNAGSNLRAAGEAIAQRPGAGMSIMEKAIKGQKETEGGRVTNVINQTMGRDVGRVSNRKLVAAERKAAGRQMKVAKSAGIVHDLKGLDKDVVNMMEASEGPVKSAMDAVSKFGVFNRGGKATSEQLHQARMALDTMLAKKIGDTSLEGQAKVAVSEIRKRIDTILKNEVPGMRQADKSFQIAATKSTAFEDGRKALQQALSPDEVAEKLKGYNKLDVSVGDQFKRGVRDNVSRIMGTARNDALAASRELSEKGWNDQKLASVIGRGATKKLNSFLEGAKSRQDTANTVIGNSATARRLEAGKMFPSPAGQEQRLDAMAAGGVTGVPVRMALGLGNKLTGGALGRRSDRINADAARLLTKQGPEAQQLIGRLAGPNVMRANKQARDATEAAILGGSFSGNNAFQSRQPVTVGVRPPTNILELERLLLSR